MMSQLSQQHQPVIIVVVIAINVILSSLSPLTLAAATTTTITPTVVVDTSQTDCYDNNKQISCPAAETAPFYGQDAQFIRNPPSYEFSDDEKTVVKDKETGLEWTTQWWKKGWVAAGSDATSINIGGHSDWRLPSLKELYSLIEFNGYSMATEQQSKPYIDVSFFSFAFGDDETGGRLIDAQYWTTNKYIGKTMGDKDECVLGVNFADGRIKCYPIQLQSTQVKYVRYVRGAQYGKNDFEETPNELTIKDHSTGLEWTKHSQIEMSADKKGKNWQDSLSFISSLNVDGYNDWRMPNPKELQGIVDYSRAPDVTNSAAIDPIFSIPSFQNENKQTEYPYFWTSTTHLEGQQYTQAVYVAFGRCPGYFGPQTTLMDVHGAGCQRSDPKVGDPADFPQGRGPQGDVIRIFNDVRAVRTFAKVVADNTSTLGDSQTTKTTDQNGTEISSAVPVTIGSMTVLMALVLSCL